uniref:Uncharacterized protein n=1 Tax=Manihot esculenta TaxID=3983 RepID=A0A2C9USW5_MANES
MGIDVPKSNKSSRTFCLSAMPQQPTVLLPAIVIQTPLSLSLTQRTLLTTPIAAATLLCKILTCSIT